MGAAAQVGWLSAVWAAPPSVQAGCTTRAGGASRGACASFNLASHVGDDPRAVATNRARLTAALALPAAPLWLSQVHGTEVVVHDGRTDLAPTADAAVAFAPGRVLAILTADCLPVVFASRDGTRIGAAHAGWRGLAAGVLERTLAALATEPAALVAWIGPAIGPAAFEVGAEVRAAFVAACAEDAAAFVPNARGRWQADLVGLARRRLARAGVAAVDVLGACTVTDSARFYSYRRDAASGRLATLVWRSA